MPNIAQFFSQHLNRPQHVVYRHFSGERWQDVAIGELAAQIARWQAAFRREGFVPGDRIGFEQALSESPLRKRLFDACIASGTRIAARHGTVGDRLMLPWLRLLVAHPIRARLGGCLRFSVVGGAALDPELA